MNRRSFLGVSLGAVVASQLPKPPGKRIGYILDAPRKITCIDGSTVICGDGSEYFFAHTAAQDRQLRQLAQNISPLFPVGSTDDFSRWNYSDGKGVFVCDDHGHKETYVRYACVILLPKSAGHPAFESVRRTAERWY